MSWFCRHAWDEVTRTFVDPIPVYYLDQVYPVSARAMHLTGFTVILFKCSKCTKFKREEMQGHVHQPKVVPLRKIEGGR